MNTMDVHALRDPRRPLPVDARPIAAAAQALDLEGLDPETRDELGRVVSALQRALLGYPCGLRPSKARHCPRVVAGKRCLRAWGHPEDDCRCVSWRLLDHTRMWLDADGRHVLTAEPYHVDGDELVAFAEWCRGLGLRVGVSGSSPYFPGRTVLLVVERAHA